ncbi:MAG TPA: DUF4301 family protein [Flavobacteriales bacterium]
MILTPEDDNQLKERGLTAIDLFRQIELFTKQTKPLKLERPCSINDGITALSTSECKQLVEYYESHTQGKEIIAFIPASGAASRMFKHLHNYSSDMDNDLTEEFILHFQHFPFVDKLAEVMAANGISLEEEIKQDNWQLIFDYILSARGLNYDGQLKGMVLFHKYDTGCRTAFEEHLHEFIRYGKQSDGKCRLHFTIAPQHLESVKEFMNGVVAQFPYEEIELTYSVQDSKTDTIALNRDNEPVRDSAGRLVFRPGGHGALIQNLENLSADIIFIKNIDNVTTSKQADDTVFYKKILGGLLLQLKEQVNNYLNELDAGNESILEEVLEFIHDRFQPGIPIGMNTEQLMQYAKLRLDRPLRVCGMVRNQGEPGGGPFWVRVPGGYFSKQIVEKSQLESDNVQQMKIFNSSTHFNPVDIACSIRKRDGSNYKLENFVDYSTGFISEKFQQGHIVKALELPGLWNGSMALWNTVFVEVPVSTFNPVKTVNDLLRPGHQN